MINRLARCKEAKSYLVLLGRNKAEAQRGKEKTTSKAVKTPGYSGETVVGGGGSMKKPKT